VVARRLWERPWSLSILATQCSSRTFYSAPRVFFWRGRGPTFFSIPPPALPLRLRRKAGRKQCTNRNRPVVCVASYFPRRRPCASTTFRFDAFKRRGRILIDQKMRCDAPRLVTVLRSHHRHRQHETTPAGVYHARGCALAPESGDIVTFGLVCHNDRAAETKCAGGIL
jgi:hypothetical protein